MENNDDEDETMENDGNMNNNASDYNIEERKRLLEEIRGL